MSSHWIRHNWHRVLAHALALAPLTYWGVNYLRDDLTFNPVRYLILRTGSVGLILLLASLACTPINTLFGWRQAVQIRKPLGLYAFAYAALHLLIYALLENRLDALVIWRDLWERRAMIVGMVAFLVLVPLAVTSTSGWKRRLGKRWRMLHWLVYLAAPLSVLHFYWLDRDIQDVPLRYAVVLAALLALRLPPVRRAIMRARYRLGVRSGAGGQPAPIDQRVVEPRGVTHGGTGAASEHRG